MENRLPYGGREIAELRSNRQRPADMVLVSLIGPLYELNPIVIANPEKAYNWRFLSGLEVLIVANASMDKAQVKSVVGSVAAFSPEYLGLWLSDKQEGVHIAFGSYCPLSKAARWMSPYDRKTFKGIGR